MAALYIKCPTTGKPVHTGMNIPENMKLSVFSDYKLSCEECFQTHTWSGKDAFFVKDPKHNFLEV